MDEVLMELASPGHPFSESSGLALSDAGGKKRSHCLTATYICDPEGESGEHSGIELVMEYVGRPFMSIPTP
jgi:hypothetical protein